MIAVPAEESTALEQHARLVDLDGIEGVRR